jgi:hypothetical protein
MLRRTSSREEGVVLKISSNRRLFICFFVVFIFLQDKNVSAISNYTVLTELNSQSEFSLSHLVRKLQVLKEKAGGPRRQFESLSVYESRIDKNLEKLKEFTSKRFRISVKADEVFLDRENSRLKVQLKLPISSQRKRGGGIDSNTLVLSFELPSSKARSVFSFSNAVIVESEIQFSRHDYMIFQNIRVWWNDEKIYEEN